MHQAGPMTPQLLSRSAFSWRRWVSAFTFRLNGRSAILRQADGLPHGRISAVEKRLETATDAFLAIRAYVPALRGALEDDPSITGLAPPAFPICRRRRSWSVELQFPGTRLR